MNINKYHIHNIEMFAYSKSTLHQTPCILYLQVQKIHEALHVTQKANLDFHKDAEELALTQDKIIQLFIEPYKEEYIENVKSAQYLLLNFVTIESTTL